MDLFTYLMAKNGHNTSINEDLFSYLLGKSQGGGGEIKTATGITINIPDAKKLVSFMMTKESTQDGEPTPDNPQEIKTVKGYRNLFDKSTENVGKFISSSNGSLVSVSAWNTSEYIEVNSNLKYILSAYEVANSQFAFGEYTSNQTFINRIDSTGDRKSFILNLNPNTKYIRVCYRNDKVSKEIQLTEGDQELPYIPYGNNYVNVAVSDGTNTNNYPIPLMGNEIVGIGDYKDELKVDKSGHVFINKKTGKVVFDGNENWADRPNYNLSDRFVLNYTTIPTQTINPLCNYFKTYRGITDSIYYLYLNKGEQIGVNFSVKGTTTLEQFKEWLSTHNTDVYYVLAEENLIDLQTTVDLKLFKGVNNVSNSEDGYMTIEYK